jgi:hypothetical protein
MMHKIATYHFKKGTLPKHFIPEKLFGEGMRFSFTRRQLLFTSNIHLYFTSYIICNINLIV